MRTHRPIQCSQPDDADGAGMAAVHATSQQGPGVNASGIIGVRAEGSGSGAQQAALLLGRVLE